MQNQRERDKGLHFVAECRRDSTRNLSNASTTSPDLPVHKSITHDYDPDFIVGVYVEPTDKL